MITLLEGYLKFIVKMKIATPLRSLLLFFLRKPVNTENWDKRVLIINLEAIGDLIMFTSVLKHYKKAFPGKRIYLLMKHNTGLDKIFEKNFVDQTILLNYKKFGGNPFYGAKIINFLRGIGFKTVVNHDFSAAEIIGKIITVELGAEEVIGYEGQAIEFQKPFDVQQKKNLEIIRKKFFPRYTDLIPMIYSDSEKDGRIRHEINYYKAIYEHITGRKESNYATVLPVNNEDATIKKFNLPKNKYAVLNVNASVGCKRWPLERFVKVAEYLSTKVISIVLVGSPGEKKFVEEFKKICSVQMIDAVGKTKIEDLINLVANSLLVVSNDTSTIHIAVALKKPSLCVVGGGQFGVAINYGYPDINKWVYKKTPCYFDNWRCCLETKKGKAGPCVLAVSAAEVIRELDALLKVIKDNQVYSDEEFKVEF